MLHGTGYIRALKFKVQDIVMIKGVITFPQGKLFDHSIYVESP